jgi:capsule biosynthesis phosphatase
MRICLDLDGTVCENKEDGARYSDVLPMPGAVETIARWRAEGHYVVLQTARGMRTYNSNEGQILAHMKLLHDWLEKWNIVVDEIRIGKPHCDIFIDDKGYKHTNWTDTAAEIQRRLS